MQKKIQLSILGESYLLVTDEMEAQLIQAARTLEEQAQLLCQRTVQGVTTTPLRAVVLTGLQALCSHEALLSNQQGMRERLTHLCHEIDKAQSLLT